MAMPWALGVFVVLGIGLIAGPLILGLAIAHDRPLARFLRRHVRGVYFTQAVAGAGFTVCAFFVDSEIRWLWVGTGSLWAVCAVFLAIRGSKGGLGARR